MIENKDYYNHNNNNNNNNNIFVTHTETMIYFNRVQ